MAITFVTFNLVFFPMHFLGMRGMPRRIYDYTQYSHLKGLQPMNEFMTIALFVLGRGQLILVAELLPVDAPRAVRPETIPGTRTRSSGRLPRRRPMRTSRARIPTVYRGPVRVQRSRPRLRLLAPERGPAGRRPRTMADATPFGRTAPAPRARGLHGFAVSVAAATLLLDLRRRAGDLDRVGPLGARLADDLRPEHVHVSAVQVGRRHPLRALAPPDRLGGRASDVALAVWLARREPRRWVRRLG